MDEAARGKLCNCGAPARDNAAGEDRCAGSLLCCERVIARPDGGPCQVQALWLLLYFKVRKLQLESLMR